MKIGMTEPVADDDIITTTEAAALLKVHQVTVCKLLRDGLLPGAKLGVGKSRWRLRRSELLKFISQRKRGGRVVAPRL